jgi:anthranilate phosphoribosyltransferase
MCNPAGVKRQLLGVFSPKWLLTIAKVLAELGSRKVWVVHGQGFDEIAIDGPSHVAALENGTVRTFDVSPADAGLPTHAAEAIAGGDAAHNAAALRGVLEGRPSAYRDIVVLNTAAALVVADRAKDIREGARFAAEAIDRGAALAVLDRLIAVSRQGLAKG